MKEKKKKYLRKHLVKTAELQNFIIQLLLLLKPQFKLDPYFLSEW